MGLWFYLFSEHKWLLGFATANFTVLNDYKKTYCWLVYKFCGYRKLYNYNIYIYY